MRIFSIILSIFTGTLAAWAEPGDLRGELQEIKFEAPYDKADIETTTSVRTKSGTDTIKIKIPGGYTGTKTQSYRYSFVNIYEVEKHVRDTWCSQTVTIPLYFLSDAEYGVRWEPARHRQLPWEPEWIEIRGSQLTYQGKPSRIILKTKLEGAPNFFYRQVICI